ncbi:MAG: HAD-IA family hydrolase [Rhabdochlamydiaceae bacterium]
MQPILPDPKKYCIVFDLGKTVFDKPYKFPFTFNVLYQFPALVNPFTIIKVWRAINKSKEEAKKSNRTGANTSWDQIFATTYARPLLKCSEEQFNQKVSLIIQNTANPYPGMLEFIMKLYKNGYPLAVLSNSDHLTAQVILKSNFFKNYFQEVCLSSETGVKKPDPEAFINLLNKVHRTAQECIFFDDNKKNIEAAQELGFKAYLIKNPSQIYTTLEQLGVVLSNQNPTTDNPLVLTESYV